MRQRIWLAPASHEAHTRRPRIQRPKNTAFGPWRSKNGSPILSTARRWRWKRPGRCSSQRPPLRPIWKPMLSPMIAASAASAITSTI